LVNDLILLVFVLFFIGLTVADIVKSIKVGERCIGNAYNCKYREECAGLNTKMSANPHSSLF